MPTHKEKLDKIVEFSKSAEHFERVRARMGTMFHLNPEAFTLENGHVDVQNLYDSARMTYSDLRDGVYTEMSARRARATMEAGKKTARDNAAKSYQRPSAAPEPSKQPVKALGGGPTDAKAESVRASIKKAFALHKAAAA